MAGPCVLAGAEADLINFSKPFPHPQFNLCVENKAALFKKRIGQIVVLTL
jgi:hypothetical protein